MVELVSWLELSGGVPEALETVETAGGSMVSEQDLLNRVGGQKNRFSKEECNDQGCRTQLNSEDGSKMCNRRPGCKGDLKIRLFEQVLEEIQK